MTPFRRLAIALAALFCVAASPGSMQCALAPTKADRRVDAVARDPAPDPRLPPAALELVEPSKIPCSLGARVTLRGKNFAQVREIRVAHVKVTDIQLVDANTITAVLPPVRPSERGKLAVEVVLADWRKARLADAIEYFFDEDPVVLVHGYLGQAWHMAALADRLISVGYPKTHVWQFAYSNPVDTNLKNVLELKAYVDQVLTATGAQKVDLVAHSMGGLSTRLYIREYGGGEKVRDYVTIAGAHHGTQVALLATPTDGAREMSPPYACEGQALHDIQFKLNGCVTETGRRGEPVDETPFGVEDGGGVAYLSVYSIHDEIIRPAESSCLNQAKRNDCSDPVNVKVDGVGHGGVLTDNRVFARMLSHLQKRNAFKPQGEPPRAEQ